MTITKRCGACGAEFEAQRSSAKFCSTRCRKRAHDARHRRPYEPVLPPKPPDVSVAAAPVECEAALQTAHRLANDFGRLSRTAPYQLQAKFARISAAIAAALEEEGL